MHFVPIRHFRQGNRLQQKVQVQISRSSIRRKVTGIVDINGGGDGGTKVVPMAPMKYIVEGGEEEEKDTKSGLEHTVEKIGREAESEHTAEGRRNSWLTGLGMGRRGSQPRGGGGGFGGSRGGDEEGGGGSLLEKVLLVV